ncbi:MAG: hypothetical protein QF863_05480, partial [Pseudomonadales bacterium]|nr:hypothetical protein [Pseudomonadales bacterium]
MANHANAIMDGWRAVPRNINIHDNDISNSGSNPNGYLIQDIINAYVGNYGSFPTILYDGLGEAVARSGQGASILEPDFAADGSDDICVSNNGNISIGQLFAGDHSGDFATPDLLLYPSAIQQEPLLNCTQLSLPIHSVTFGDQVFGCGIDDDT